MSQRRLRVVGITANEEAARREAAFQDWLAKTETAYLECRDGKHIIPGLTDPRTNLDLPAPGVCLAEAACVRCGVVLRKQIGVKDGYLVGGGRSSYDYSRAPGYLLPKEATGPGGSSMDREHRGMVRLEILDRAFQARGSSLNRAIANARRRGRRGRGGQVTIG